jgi:hypothetical protein
MKIHCSRQVLEKAGISDYFRIIRQNQCNQIVPCSSAAPNNKSQIEKPSKSGQGGYQPSSWRNALVEQKADNLDFEVDELEEFPMTGSTASPSFSDEEKNSSFELGTEDSASVGPENIASSGSRSNLEEMSSSSSKSEVSSCATSMRDFQSTRKKK